MRLAERFGKKKMILGGVGLAVLLLALVYLSLGLYFNSHFWFRTTINGVKCSGRSVVQAERLIAEKINGYELRLKERDGGTELIKGTDIGLEAKFDGKISQELEKRSGFSWITSIFEKTNIELEAMVRYNESGFDEILEDFISRKAKNSREPKDAYIAEYKKGVGFEIVPEEEGTLLDEAAFREALHTAVINLQSSISLADSGCYVSPGVVADSEELLNLQKEMNSYTKAGIAYESGSTRMKLDGDTIGSWLYVTEEHTIAVDETKAAEFVKKLGESFDTAYKTRSFQTSYGSTVSLTRNEYGWYVDPEGELEQLTADIREGKQVTREPVYQQTAKSHGEKDYGDTYAEVNLTAQHMFFYKDGKLVLETDFVSGDVAKNRVTPTGAYSVTYTQKDKVLRGADYATPVSFWMPFNGGVGFHDATWRKDFGGNYYKTNGSHGCINMPYSAAKKLFSYLKTGDAVFVYELPGTESDKSLAQDAAAEVTKLIKAIGSVTLNSSEAIKVARTAYDALNDMGKSYVKNYTVLTSAETAYAGLLTEEETQQATAQAKSEAQAVIKAIEAIGEVTPEKKAMIETARSKYNALTETARQYVTNYEVLEAAEKELAGLGY